MSNYLASVRYLNGEKDMFIVHDADSHDDARDKVKSELTGLRTVLVRKLPCPIELVLPEAA